MDEVAIMDVIKYETLYNELVKRKKFVLGSIASQGKLTPELKQKIAWIGTGSLKQGRN